MDGNDAIYTVRMKQWSDAVSNVLNWTMDDGSNFCLDVMIKENMDYSLENQILQVESKLSLIEIHQLEQELGLSEGDVGMCIWYLTHAFAVNPMICSIEPRAKVKTLCKDGTSDLSKCQQSSIPSLQPSYHPSLNKVSASVPKPTQYPSSQPSITMTPSPSNMNTSQTPTAGQPKEELTSSPTQTYPTNIPTSYFSDNLSGRLKVDFLLIGVSLFLTMFH